MMIDTTDLLKMVALRALGALALAVLILGFFAFFFWLGLSGAQ